LTQVKGEASLVGLKSGDYLKSVNGQNVSKMSHNDVVKLITASNGILRLKIIENSNYNASNSDDSEFDHKDLSSQRPRYPYRHRKATNSSNSIPKQCLSSHNYHHHYHNHHNRPPFDRRTRRKEVKRDQIRSNEALLDLLLEQRLQQIDNNLSDNLSESDDREPVSHCEQKQSAPNIQCLAQYKQFQKRALKSSSLIDQKQNSFFTDQQLNHILYHSLERIVNVSQLLS
jgi:hypothetical protein